MQGGGGGASIVFGLAVLVAVIAIVALIGTVILRAAISLFNRMTSNPVPEPSFGSAFLIWFASTIVNFIVQFAMSFLFGMTGAAGGEKISSGNLLLSLIGFPVSLVVMAAMISAMLPTTFGRGFLIALLNVLIAFVLVFIIALAIGAVIVATGVGR